MANENQTRILITFGLIGLLGVLIIKIISLPLAIVVVFILGLWFVGQYNTLQSLSQEIKESHSNILIAVKKRLDLANKLMEIAANYADLETTTHLGVSKLENTPLMGNPEDAGEGILSRFVMMSRAYPALQANQTYQVLMEQLETIENQLQQKRETYNIKVRTYNTRRTSIPMIFISDKVGFKEAYYFDAINADVAGELKDFKTADSQQLKSFLSGLGSQVVEKSESVGSTLSEVTKTYLDPAGSNGSKDDSDAQQQNTTNQTSSEST